MNKNEFIEELENLDIYPTEEQLNQLEKYYEMLIEYNKKMNLTAITDKEDVYLKHFYDSLTIIKVIDLNKENSLCDLGSGAGFPGLVLKIFYPHLSITLVDALEKRIKFLKEVIKELNLHFIEAIHDRIEEYSVKNVEEYDVVTARAVTNLSALLEMGSPLIKVNKYFIAMKGNFNEEYKNALKELKLKEESCIEFDLPKEEGHRTLIKITKREKTPEKYPRKYSEIKKKTL